MSLSLNDFEVVVQRAIAHRDGGDLEAAVAGFDAAIAACDSDPVVFVHRGITYGQLGQFDAAIADFDRAIALAPNDPWVWSNRAIACGLMGQFDAAIDSFGKAVALIPEDTQTLASRGETLREMGRFEEALGDLNRVLALDADYFGALISRGHVLMQLGQFDAAAADFDRAIAVGNGHPDAFAGRAEVYRQMGEAEAAMEMFGQALEAMPDHLGALIGRGEVLRECDQLEDAFLDFDRALIIAPDDPDLLSARGDMLRQLGRSAEAIRDFTRALEIFPDHLWALMGRGVALRMDNDPEASLVDFDRAVMLQNGDAWIWANRGESRRMLGQYEAAVSDFTRALDIDPENGWARELRAETFRQMGRFAEAVEDIESGTGAMSESHHIVIADRTVPFEETIAQFGEALSKKCRFQTRARRFYDTVWIADCYTDYVQSALFRKYEGPLMEGIALRTMGKGLSKQQVLAGAMAKAVERISFFDALASGRETPIYELTSDVELVPTDMKASDVPHLNDSANGVSAGNTVLECVFHGLLEMHEHLDVGRHFYWPGLEHRQFIDPNLTGFFPRVSEKMLAVAVPGENDKVTTVHAVVCPKDLGPLVRTCTHLDGRVALQRAFNETVQSHKTRFVSDLQTFGAEIALWDLPNHFTDDLITDIQVVLSGMKSSVYVQDWTDPEMQIPVLRPFSLKTAEHERNHAMIETYVHRIMVDSGNYIVWT